VQHREIREVILPLGTLQLADQLADQAALVLIDVQDW